jgi:hypothetical protein
MSFSKQTQPYRDFILHSRGEFTVAKNQNVRLRSGWFSDRSACYLPPGVPSSGTPVRKFSSTGEGLFSFNTMEDIVAAMEVVNADYESIVARAQTIAEEYFGTEKL